MRQEVGMEEACETAGKEGGGQVEREKETYTFMS